MLMQGWAVGRSDLAPALRASLLHRRIPAPANISSVHFLRATSEAIQREGRSRTSAGCGCRRVAGGCWDRVAQHCGSGLTRVPHEASPQSSGTPEGLREVSVYPCHPPAWDNPNDYRSPYPCIDDEPGLIVRTEIVVHRGGGLLEIVPLNVVGARLPECGEHVGAFHHGHDGQLPGALQIPDHLGYAFLEI